MSTLTKPAKGNDFRLFAIGTSGTQIIKDFGPLFELSAYNAINKSAYSSAILFDRNGVFLGGKMSPEDVHCFKSNFLLV